MVAVDLKSLVGRLNDLCRRSLEAAAGLTLSRSNFHVEIEHWLLERPPAPVCGPPPSGDRSAAWNSGSERTSTARQSL